MTHTVRCMLRPKRISQILTFSKHINEILAIIAASTKCFTHMFGLHFRSNPRNTCTKAPFGCHPASSFARSQREASRTVQLPESSFWRTSEPACKFVERLSPSFAKTRSGSCSKLRGNAIPKCYSPPSESFSYR